MSAGGRDQKIALERYTTTTDEWNEEQQSWVPLGNEWVKVFYGRGSERREQASEQGRQAATFQMLSNSQTRGLTLKDRVVFSGSNWDIEDIALNTPDRGHLEVTALRSR